MAFNNKKKDFKNFRNNEPDRYKETTADKQKPEQETYGYTMPGDYKSMVSPIIVKADPYSEGTTVGEPYAITNKLNKTIDVTYAGKENTAGNVLPQLRSRLDVGNKLMKKFDSAKLHLSLNYLYLAMNDSDANIANNYQMEQAFEEALSMLSAEVLTQISGLNYVYNSSGTTFPVTDGYNAMFGASILYQSILQNLNAAIIGYNKVIANEKVLMDMSFNTTTTQILELYNLLKKSTFSGKLRAIADLIVGEYFDLNWARQMNVIQVGLSHKTQSFTDPNLEIFGTHRLPVVDIGIHPVGGSYASVIKTTKYVSNGSTLPELVRTFLDKLSVTSIITWARGLVFGEEDKSAKAYFNELDSILDAIRDSVKTFKSDFSGVRTVYDVLNKSGMMYWNKKVVAEVISRPGTIMEPVRNRLTEDIYRSLVGMKTIKFDDLSMKYRYYTIWDKYDGIAKFDMFSGGSFIQFSSKTPENMQDGSHNPSNLIPQLYIPDTKVIAVNRLGETVQVDIIDMPALSKTTTWPVDKLNPLSIDIPIKLARAQISTTPTFDADLTSHLQDFILEVFGLGVIEKTGGTSSYQFVIKPSYISYIDIEVDNQSEAMLDFCRTYSPFRLQTPNAARTIGFKI